MAILRNHSSQHPIPLAISHQEKLTCHTRSARSHRRKVSPSFRWTEPERTEEENECIRCNGHQGEEGENNHMHCCCLIIADQMQPAWDVYHHIMLGEHHASNKSMEMRRRPGNQHQPVWDQALVLSWPIAHNERAERQLRAQSHLSKDCTPSYHLARIAMYRL